MAAKTKIHWEDVKIEKGIPVPPSHQYAVPSTAAFDRMEPNDSITVPYQYRANLNAAVARYRKAHKGKQFVTRAVNASDVVRCWRIK